MLCTAGCTTHRLAPPPSLADLGLADSYTSSVLVSSDERSEGAISRPDLDKWWQSFEDPVLDALVERGRSNNLDVREAGMVTANKNLKTKGFTAASALKIVRSKVEADVAQTYVVLRSRQAIIENMRDFVVHRQGVIQLARFRAQAGLVLPLDAAQAVASRDAMAARIPDLQARNLQDAGRLAVLTGQAPGALADLLDGTAQLRVGPADVQIGRPSDLPLQWAGTSAPLAKGAAVPAELNAGQIAYKRQVLKAMQAVEAQNIAFRYARLRESGFAAAETTAETAARLARTAYGEGLADYSTLDRAETSLLATRNALQQSKAKRALALIGLYMALRGEGGAAARADPVSD